MDFCATRPSKLADLPTSIMPPPPPTTTTLCVLAFLAVAVTGAAAGGGTTTTHLHLYIHETLTGANATAASLAPSPLAGSNSSFGSVGAFDDELREGSDAASAYLGRAEGLLVQADLANPAALWTMLTLVFTDGDYTGSTLVLDGRVDFAGGGGTAERAVVGGTGRFRRARGYTLMSKFGNPTPSTVVFEMDIYVAMA
ncbi:dirigent protein 1-like isoform X2 [Oryza brachyantha]|nr:dirigent protein 1-like isoform X2 [Oryza brachyantha]